jgi:hypothetical protein
MGMDVVENIQVIKDIIQLIFLVLFSNSVLEGRR